MANAQQIESAIDKVQAGVIPVSLSAGGMSFSSMVEVMEFAKIMALAGVCLPAHLRNNPGACLAITLRAIEWKMSPFAVADKSYSVNDRLSFESQLVHAVIEQRAPITGRLRHKFSGEGVKRRCTVWAHVKGEAEPLEYTSPEIGQITPKNSPLWKTKPDLQLYYNTTRDWARVYFPDVILGVYASDEIIDSDIIDQPNGHYATPVPMPRAIGELPESVDPSPEPTPEPEPVSDVASDPAPDEHSEPSGWDDVANEITGKLPGAKSPADVDAIWSDHKSQLDEMQAGSESHYREVVAAKFKRLGELQGKKK